MVASIEAELSTAVNKHVYLRILLAVWERDNQLSGGTYCLECLSFYANARVRTSNLEGLQISTGFSPLVPSRPQIKSWS